MAIKPDVSLLLVSLAVSFFLPTGNGASLVSSTCSGTAFPDVCTSTLQSDPRSATADQVGLARISLELTVKVASDARKQANDLATNTKDYGQWSLLSNCFNDYDAGITDIQKNGFRLFDQKNYNQVFGKVDALKSYGDHCESLKIPQLTEKNTALINFATDVKTILQLLH